MTHPTCVPADSAMTDGGSADTSSPNRRPGAASNDGANMTVVPKGGDD